MPPPFGGGICFMLSQLTEIGKSLWNEQTEPEVVHRYVERFGLLSGAFLQFRLYGDLLLQL